ncbi:MAG TPA: ABC transporter permease [Gemmatimonadaceae bacterium]|nr:ABC transporter permease [Gemmatimonadaceae bacterium]
MPKVLSLSDLLLRGRGAVSNDVDEEIALHIDARARALVQEGLSPDAARAEALRRFGDVSATRRSMVTSAMRQRGRARRRDQMENTLMDLRHTVRQLRRSPGFASAVVITLALGIGATSAMFGVLDRLLLRPPSDVREPERLGRLYLHRLDEGQEITITEVSYHRFDELRRGAAAAIDVAAAYYGPVVTGNSENARQVRGALVSGNFWSVLGARPALGRFFTLADETPPDGTPLAVLGHGFWRDAYGADSSVLGTTLDVGAGRFTIIGVAPPGFTGDGVTRVDLWLPAATARAVFTHLDAEWIGRHNFSWLSLIGRLQPGMSPPQAEALLGAAYRHSLDAVRGPTPGAERAPRASLWPLLLERGPERTDGTRVAMWVGAVALLVLLLACANVANLLLARGLRRRNEIAVRLALGVSRARLVRQLLVESLLLAALGAAAGMVLAWQSSGFLYATLFPGLEIAASAFDRRILLFAALMGLAACLLSGLGPALYASRADLRSMMGTASRSHGHRSALRTGLLVAQAALSTILLVGAGLFVRSLREARSTDLGFDADRLVVARIQVRSATGLPGGSSPVYREFLEPLRGVPGVTAATTTLQIPFSTSGSTSLAVPGIDSVERFGQFRLNGVGEDYFETTGTRILQGRALNRNDRAGSPLVLVVSDSMARVLWPGESALGKCVQVGGPHAPCSEVVGVAANIHQYDIRAEPSLQYWFPESQNQGNNSGAFGVLARVQGDPAAMLPAVRRALEPHVPGSAFLTVRTLRESVDRVLRPWRLGAAMFGLFGLLGLVIAAVGLYSVLAYSVGQRRREIGVRSALGAQRIRVMRMVLSQGLCATGIGVGIGLLVVLAVGRWLEPLLVGVGPRDPMVLALVATTLLGTALLASVVPAWRATRVDPALALREE